MRGCVIAGRGLGRRLGFPTINVAVTGETPPPGVYAGVVRIDDARYPAAVHVGERPTLGDATPIVEAHLIGYQGEVGGREVTVRVQRRLRGVRRFATLAALRAQIEIDVQQSREAAGETPAGDPGGTDT
jgi:riboflavin kinase/FMN adenylyltransferase